MSREGVDRIVAAARAVYGRGGFRPSRGEFLDCSGTRGCLLGAGAVALAPAGQWQWSPSHREKLRGTYSLEPQEEDGLTLGFDGYELRDECDAYAYIQAAALAAEVFPCD